MMPAQPRNAAPYLPEAHCAATPCANRTSPGGTPSHTYYFVRRLRPLSIWSHTRGRKTTTCVPKNNERT
jgi:hypothetical protein